LTITTTQKYKPNNSFLDPHTLYFFIIMKILTLRHAVTLTSLVTCGFLQAFPPAPYYRLYGMVRDQTGQTIKAEGALLILLKDGEEIGRTPINSELLLDQNYDLAIRLDQNRSGTQIYTEKALATQSQFSLVVEINDTRFYPIEVAGNLSAGKGGERVRLDLNLGEDSDGDSLPDVWEQWQLYQSGHNPDDEGNWPIHLIDRNGDLDKDGQSNYSEYLAGTFAGDATETFELAIKEKLEDKTRFEFFAVIGKTYTIEESTDGQTWTLVPFSPAGDSEVTYRATESAVISAFTTSSTANALYRLTVR
jgi:hypothetical protein